MTEQSTPERKSKPTAPWICSDCLVVRSKPEKRLPSGWKHRDDGQIFCADCWAKRYILRAIAIPVVSPLDLSWEDFRTLVRLMWRETTRAANWMMTECWARDVRRQSDEKMPPMPAIYLYPEARAKFPSLPSSSIAALEHTVKKKYKAKRYEVLWTSASSLPTHRYPTPFAVPNQAWSLSMELEAPVASVNVGDHRIKLRLKSGARFRRQLVSARSIASGNAVQGELALYEKGKDVMCKMVAWLPRVEASTVPKDGVLTVKTGKDWLLTAYNIKDEKPWVYNADHVRRWSAEHANQLQRWSEDQKAEERPVASFQQRREAAADKYRNRMDTACHTIAAMLVNLAKRRKFKTLEYDGTEHSFLETFSWFKLAEIIYQKCDAAGIEFKLASSEVISKSA